MVITGFLPCLANANQSAAGSILGTIDFEEILDIFGGKYGGKTEIFWQLNFFPGALREHRVVYVNCTKNI